jgi:hypothetical protein
MAGGSLTISVDSYGQLQAVAQRVLCWVASANKPLVKVNSAAAGASGWGITIPEEIFNGSLVLIRGGTNLVAGYVAGTNIVASAGNGLSIQTNVNTCPASTNQPTTTTPFFVTNVGGLATATTLTYANVGGAGTVNIDWGDGTTTAGAAESGSANHTYPWPNREYLVTITDASSSTDVGQLLVRVGNNVA